ncbi:MAG: response regulator [bacterium]
MSDALRILAVDDSLTIRKALELILVPAGYAVTFAASGADGLAAARQAPPDVMLLDFILPDLRGSEVCRALREDAATAAVPVVLISARGAEIEQAYRDLPNVVRYLGKPFTPEDVLAVVAEVARHGLSVPAVTDTERAIAAAAPALDDVFEGMAAVEPAAAVDCFDAARPNGVVSEPMYASPSVAAADALAGDTMSGGDVEVASSSQDLTARRAFDITVSAAPQSSPPHHAAADWLFETLRDGLEGVYVEELDTPAGALADRVQSYTDLAARVREQLGEALRQAESGAPYALCDDGSIRSLGETLLDGYRRVCRLVFRAAAAGVLTRAGGDAVRPRVLVACHRDSPVYAPLTRAVADADDWLAVQVASDFRQLPMTVRLFGPTHVLVDGSPGGPLWDQLALARRLPEGQRLQCIGVLPDGVAEGRPELAAVVRGGDDLLAALRACVQPSLDAAA